MNKNYIFISISSIALLIVLLIQINWMIETAKIKEALFNEKANIVLAKTAEALSADKETCKKMAVCVGKEEIQKTDSLFTNYMNFYNFRPNYSFAVTEPSLFGVNGQFSIPPSDHVYKKRLTEIATDKGLELNLFVPDKKQFILAEMGPMFITSVCLILIVFVLFLRSVLLLIKEKKISEHTTDFLNNMTHEFKAPLTNIALAAKMVTKEANIKQEAKIKHYLGIIVEENEKLRLHVEQMLSMSALERGEIPLRKTALNFHQLIQDALKCIYVQIEHQQGHLQLDLHAEQAVVMGDKTQLTNALCNLIDNAIKYAQAIPELYIQTLNKGSNLVIIVADKGIGIEKEYQKKVFDKFFRVPTGDVHDVKGFGLGLTYLKKIVELHQGSIELQSEKGKGTTFTIILPHV